MPNQKVFKKQICLYLKIEDFNALRHKSIRDDTNLSDMVRNEMKNLIAEAKREDVNEV
jgi:hypothetical protein